MPAFITPRLALGAAMIAATLLAPRGAGAHSAAAARVRDVTAFPGTLVVYKRFGAALRQSPSSNAAIIHTIPCGVTVRVIGQSGGWYHVRQGSRPWNGWVGGARVADAGSPPEYDCTDAYTFQPLQHAYSYVRAGCLSLRVDPSRHARFNYCVKNFHDYIVTNGPIEVAGEDWFGVYSRSTGGGWSLAAYLLPYPRMRS